MCRCLVVYVSFLRNKSETRLCRELGSAFTVGVRDRGVGRGAEIAVTVADSACSTTVSPISVQWKRSFVSDVPQCAPCGLEGSTDCSSGA